MKSSNFREGKPNFDSGNHLENYAFLVILLSAHPFATWLETRNSSRSGDASELSVSAAEEIFGILHCSVAGMEGGFSEEPAEVGK